MIPRSFAAVVLTFGAALSAPAAELPEPAELVEKVIQAAGGEAFADIGVLKLEVRNEQILHGGGTTVETFTAYVDTASKFAAMRMELPGDVVLARAGAMGWSTADGVIDDRPQTPSMAFRTLNQSLFTILLPFSLEMEGVWAKEVIETTWEDREAWALLLPFTKGFFVSPVLETTWRVVVDKETYAVLAADFMPAERYREVERVGVRYGYLAQQEVAGAKIASNILSVGLGLDGMETGDYRITKVESSVFEGWAPALFLSPQQLEALEDEGEPQL